jgi:CBS domain-containing protein
MAGCGPHRCWPPSTQTHVLGMAFRDLGRLGGSVPDIEEVTTARLVREAMTAEPICLTSNTTLIDAAAQMREYDIGDVLITEQDRILGVLTDRDIVVRALADGKDPARTTAGEIASSHLVTVAPDDPVGRAVQLMRENAVRRLPVCQDGRPVGIVSIADLAVEQDPHSALADISAAPANR